ncbi:MAG: hypothetical protein A2Y07_07385 [Planctomycetes bacterium GWF2_50_10]|nr:MAG: hypothetical protein A2Y07_07385 [Planctomycetes bacterium GWF2_50_10]
MRTHGKVLILCLGVLAIVAAGCKTTQPGVTQTWNRLETLVEANPAQVTQAAAETLQELDLAIVSSTSSKLSGEVIARTPDDKRVTVTVKPRPNGLSEMYVHTGYWGDTNTSQRIINRIKAKLYSGRMEGGSMQGQSSDIQRDTNR